MSRSRGGTPTRADRSSSSTTAGPAPTAQAPLSFAGRPVSPRRALALSAHSCPVGALLSPRRTPASRVAASRATTSRCSPCDGRRAAHRPSAPVHRGHGDPAARLGGRRARSRHVGRARRPGRDVVAPPRWTVEGATLDRTSPAPSRPRPGGPDARSPSSPTADPLAYRQAPTEPGPSGLGERTAPSAVAAATRSPGRRRHVVVDGQQETGAPRLWRGTPVLVVRELPRRARRTLVGDQAPICAD